MEDPPLQRRELLRDHDVAAIEHPARIDGQIRRGLIGRQRVRVRVVDRLEARPHAAEASIHLVAGDPEDPDQQARVAAIAGQRLEDRLEHFLADVLGFPRVAEPLQREAVDAREVALVELVEGVSTATEDAGDQRKISRRSAAHRRSRLGGRRFWRCSDEPQPNRGGVTGRRGHGPAPGDTGSPRGFSTHDFPHSNARDVLLPAATARRPVSPKRGDSEVPTPSTATLVPARAGLASPSGSPDFQTTYWAEAPAGGRLVRTECARNHLAHCGQNTSSLDPEASPS